MPSLRRALLPALALLAAACDEPASAGTPDAATSSPPAPSTSARPATSSAPRSTSSAAPAGELKVLKMSFTTAVKNKEPVDAPKHAEPGQRMWAHVAVRNRTEDAKKVALVFLVGGSERSRIDLSVDPSWSYRTWGYVTLRSGDTGDLVAEVRDEGGTVMERARLPIKSK